MTTAGNPNQEQDEYWNGEEAVHWVAQVDRYDAMLAAFNGHLFERADIDRTVAAVDIGCGCGTTTLEVAGMAADGVVVGIDLSGPMLEVATERALRRGIDNVRFERADAASHRFDPGSFDRALSRFGVMFFADPVAGFSNIARALRSEGTLTFVCWQELGRNDWIAVPGAAAATHIALPPLPDGYSPGPFSLSDPERIENVLGNAGFESVDIMTLEEPLRLGATVEDTVSFLAQTGLGRALLAEADDEARALALAAISDTLADHAGADGVKLGSRAWLVNARKGT